MMMGKLSIIKKKIGRKVIPPLNRCLKEFVLRLDNIESTWAIMDEENKQESCCDDYHSINKNVLNVSILDNYYDSYNVDKGSPFSMLLRQVELKTEFYVLQELKNEIDINGNFIAKYENIVVLKTISPVKFAKSSLRNGERQVVDRNFVSQELANLNIDIRDCDMYCMCQAIIEGHQKAALAKVKEMLNMLVTEYISTKEDEQRVIVINQILDRIRQRLRIISIRM